MSDSANAIPQTVSPSLPLGSQGPSVYLITGGTGSLGTALTAHLLNQGHRVRVYARNEHSHETLFLSLEKKHYPRFSPLVGAVEDYRRLVKALRGVDFVIHAAAQKIIHLAEFNPGECIQTNIEGTRNVIDACLEEGIGRMVLVSTDKAAAPNTLYGATKLCAERLTLSSNRYSAGHSPHFVAVRYGNVFASRGSVVHAFVEQAQKGHLDITDPEATRFHITLDQAVGFVLDALNHAAPGTLWIPKLPSYKLGDFARAFSSVYKLTGEPHLLGLRPGEKRHEDLISSNESASCHPDTQRSHYVLEPGRVHGQADWSFNSGSNVHRLGVQALTQEIRQWASL